MLAFLFSLVWAYEPKNGDIIFQSSHSKQGEQIELATKSKYSHVGIVYLDKQGEPQVYEAIGPVSFDSLEKWIKRGRGEYYTVMRLKSGLSGTKIALMKETGKEYVGKPYDFLFRWSDKKMYCSELVWKVFKYGAKIELSKPKLFREYHFDHPKVKKELDRRWGDKINWSEIVVAPSDLAQSPLLRVVTTTYPKDF